MPTRISFESLDEIDDRMSIKAFERPGYKRTTSNPWPIKEESSDDDLQVGYPSETESTDEEPEENDHDQHRHQAVHRIEDERERTVGIKKLQTLINRINMLDKELRLFDSTARGMASSSAVVSSGLRFRQRLIQLGYVAQNNAKHLFPGRVRPPKTVSEIHAHNRRPQPLREFKTSNFASEIIAFANEVETFIERLRRFQIVSEFDSSLHALRTKLQYLGKSLTKIYTLFNKDKDDAASFLEVRLHMHNRLADIGEYFDNITSSLEILRTAGMPAIHIYQQHAAENLSSLATVATLFAGVAATTIQFTWDMEPRTKVSTITVNVLWFASLVLSVAAAVDSTLVKAWRLSMYQSSREDIPWLVFVWVHHSAPLVFLVLSVASFSIGLCIFTYTSNQHFITFVLTTLLTAMTSVGLMIISTWVSFEQLAKYEDDDFERGSKADLSAILTLAHRRFQQWREAVIERKEASPPTQEESKWEIARPGLLSHEALVHDLQFSPDGRYLATASWDKYAGIYAVDDVVKSETRTSF